MNYIEIQGITTHNLKNIDINIEKNKITAIYGRSGAGKSSLAFSTLYSLCKDEFDSLENGFTEQGDYILESYSGIIPSISINQNNFNVNPKSTIYSYLRFPNLLSNNDKNLIPEYHYLKINSPYNICKQCNGLGYEIEIEKNKLIDDELTIPEKPFLCWKTGSLSNYYNSLLLNFCKEKGIPLDVPFKFLTENHKNLLLYGKSDYKVKFSFKHNGKTKQKLAYYIGAFEHSNSLISEIKNSSLPTKYKKCNNCNGSKIDLNLYKDIKIFGLNFSIFLTTPISEIINFISQNKIKVNDNFIRTLKSINNMGLGYLSLNRSIPSLSGGELQKINFSRLLNSDISGILIIIDEISSQLGSLDFPLVLKKIRKLSKNNTVVLVEHEQYFIDAADHKIHIGKNAGKNGGYICEDEIIKPFLLKKEKNTIQDFFQFNNLNKNTIKDQNVHIPKNCLTCFVGVSGSGKSSLAKAINDLGGSYYISQKVSNYSTRSILCSTIKLNTLIAEYFSKKSNLITDKFLPHKLGGCPNCQGTGTIKYERGFEKDIYLTCPVCDGKLFNFSDQDIINTIIDDKNIIDVYQTEIKDLIDYFDDKKIINILNVMDRLCLDHLHLSRKTQTLSGGELRRIKLCEYLSRQRKSDKILIIDEPTAGLDPETSSSIASFLYEKSSKFEAIIIIEHKEEVIQYCDYKVTIGPGSGSLGGKVLEQTSFSEPPSN